MTSSTVSRSGTHGYHGLFGSGSRRRSVSPSPSTNTNYTTTTYNTTNGSSIFRRSSDVGNSPRRGVLSRTFGHGNDADLDPSIVAARERVMGAEAAEREADRALEASRAAIRAAREHVRQLELEAKEEARRAKIKQ